MSEQVPLSEASKLATPDSLPVGDRTEAAQESAKGSDEKTDAADPMAASEPSDPKKKAKKSKKGKDEKRGTKLPSSRCLGGFTDEFTHRGQTFPPKIPVRKIYGDDCPPGEILEHPGDFNTYRITSEEKRNLERLATQDYQDLRRAARVHYQVRKYAQELVKPGINLNEFCGEIEDRVRLLIEEHGTDAGMAFPCAVSLNHCAAHYTPNPWDEPVFLGEHDVMKVDFGTQIRGNIIDCAFTVAFDPQFDPLLEAVKASTNTGLRCAGIDARLDEIGAEIQECMESHEVEIHGTVYPIKSIANLSGHNMSKYVIHSGKSVPLVRGGPTTKMEEGEVFAIETFGSTGKGHVIDSGETSHYMMVEDAQPMNLRLQSARQLYGHLRKTFSTLAWCPRYLERPDGGSAFLHGAKGQQQRYRGALKVLLDNGLIRDYPPLCDQKGSYVAQWEHTVILRPTCKEVVSRGDDY